jgi:hypothetical protein
MDGIVAWRRDGKKLTHLAEAFMKFSILTLLATIAYVAVLIQAIKEETSIWQLVATVAALLVTIALVLAAFHPVSRAANYTGRVALACFAFYFAVDLNDNPQSYLPPFLPHHAAARWFLLLDAPEGVMLGPDGSYIYGGSGSARQLGQYSFGVYRTKPIVGFLSAQAFGLVGGFIALMRYKKSCHGAETGSSPGTTNQ